MGNIIRGHLILISVALIVFFVGSGRKVDVRIRTPQHFDIQYDQMLTDGCKATMTQFIESLDKKIALHPNILAAVIQEQFPFIQSVQSRLVPPGIMKLHCMAATPLCILNQSLLLVPPQNICPNSYYCTGIWENLPHITLAESLFKSCDIHILTALVNNLNVDIFNQFNVSVSADRTLIFEDKIQPRFSVMCRIDKVPSATLCMHAQHMKELLESRKAFSAKSNNLYVADLRFEKQIILSKK
jgi:hypothetical protein